MTFDERCEVGYHCEALGFVQYATRRFALREFVEGYAVPLTSQFTAKF
jgi:hypothetical protein